MRVYYSFVRSGQKVRTRTLSAADVAHRTMAFFSVVNAKQMDPATLGEGRLCDTYICMKDPAKGEF